MKTATKIFICFIICVLLITGCAPSRKRADSVIPQMTSDRGKDTDKATDKPSESTAEAEETNAPSTHKPASTTTSKPDKVTQEDIEISEKEGVVSGKVKFTYSPAAQTSDDRAAAERFISAFEKKYKDVTVERDYSNVSDARIASADIGDVFFLADEHTYKYAVKDKALLPLDGFVEKFDINLSDVYSGIYSLGLVNGRLYFVPSNYNQVSLIYNKDAIFEAGVSERLQPEWTWEDFQLICEIINSEHFYPINLNLTWSPVYTAFFEAYTYRNSWCSSYEKKVTFVDEEGSILRAIKEALDLARAGHVMIPGVNDSAAVFSGKEAIFTTCVYPTVQAEGKSYDSKGIAWDLINMPLFQNPSFGCGASGVGVYSRTQNVTAAAALALFFFTPEGQKAINAGQGGSVPLLKSLDQEGYNAWKYPNDPEWSTKNWDAFVYRADYSSTPGQVKCRMPIEVADVIDSSIQKILKDDIAGIASYLDGFMALEIKCNNIWSQLNT